MTHVDPNVHAVAELFVDDLVKEAGCPVCPEKRAVLTQRIAGAAQRAIEDEYQAALNELRGDGRRVTRLFGAVWIP